MAKTKNILVTGVNSSWGGPVAEHLIELAGQRYGQELSGPREMHILGLDSEAPEQEIKGLDFIQADVRNPLLVELLKSEAIHTVCHLAFQETERPSESAFDLNVMGAMKVLGACAEAGVRKVVLKSSTAVYGARPTNSSFLTEEHPLQGSRTNGTIRDLVEIEAFCNGFRRQVPEMMLTVLRFSSIIGQSIDTPMTRFLREQWTPMLLGFDPMMQVIHEEDVIGALVYAVLNDRPGVFNLAAEGVLPLTKLISLAGKVPWPLFHPLAYWGANFLSGNRVKAAGLNSAVLAPIELDYIRYPWVVDLTRMRQDLDFTPRYTAEEALREFAGDQRLRRYLPGAAAMAYDEERLRDTIERRRRQRERQPGQEVEND